MIKNPKDVAEKYLTKLGIPKGYQAYDAVLTRAMECAEQYTIRKGKS